MPNLDGLQSTRLIRQMGYSAPIVALTAFSEESNVKECMESGMDMFLSKPIRRPALKQVLKKFATIHEEPEPGVLTRNNTDVVIGRKETATQSNSIPPSNSTLAKPIPNHADHDNQRVSPKPHTKQRSSAPQSPIINGENGIKP